MYREKLTVTGLWGWLILMMLFCLNGCRSTAVAVTSGDWESAAKQKGSAILAAVAGRDFAGYSRSAGENGGIRDREEFISSCQEMELRLGKIRNASFLTTLKTPEVTNHIYLVEFCRSGKDGRELIHQQLMQLIFGQVDGNLRLLGMRIM